MGVLDSILRLRNSQKLVGIFLFLVTGLVLNARYSRVYDLKYKTDVGEGVGVTPTSHVSTPVEPVAVATVDSEKISAYKKCLRHCGKMPKKYDAEYVTDSAVLKAHFDELMEITEPYRPMKRSSSVVYREYQGPRLEDHFMQHLANEPVESFFPIVPLFVHWTEVKFGRVGGGFETLKRKLLKVMRPDVLYFTVTSDWSYRVKSAFKDYSILFASSKGDRNAHVILPHLFYYQGAGYSKQGLPLWNLTDVHVAENDDLAGLMSKEELKKAKWKFMRYKKYQQMPNMTLNRPDLHPQRVRMTFIGSLTTHPGRVKMRKQLLRDFPNEFFNGFFPTGSVCKDTSVSSGASYCWRVFMLAGDVNLCPVGTAPVSYHLYEALQMGTIPFYIHDNRGAYIPYAGTKGDIRNGLGFVAAFEDVPQVVRKQIMQLTDEDVQERRAKVMQLRDSHFTPKGAMMQLRLWLQDPSDQERSDIRCCANPQ